jgi:hypothetical protein
MTEPVVTTTAPVLADIPNVELMQTGEWNLSTGEATFTSADLLAAVAAQECPAIRRPVLKLGHVDPRFQGEPAVGWVDNLATTASGTTLVGDFRGVPGWLKDIMPSAYPDRSIEARHNVVCAMGHTHQFVVEAVALLGVTAPGIGVLESLQDVAQLYGIAAAAGPGSVTIRIHQEVGVPERTQQVSATVTTEDVRRAYYNGPAASNYNLFATELQLDPLQLIVVDEATNALSRIPVVLGSGEGEDAVTFGEPVAIVVRYEDRPASQTAAASSLVFASRPGSVFHAGAIGRHTTATDTGPWDAGAATTNLPTEEGDAADYRKCYAWVDSSGDTDTKAAYKFPHHFVSSDGQVGAASTVGCTSGIGVLNGAMGGADIPSGDRQGIYNHLAGHLTDAGLEPADLQAAVAAASSKEGVGMDPVKLREALELKEDATDEEVLAALTTSGLVAAAPPTPAPTPPPSGLKMPLPAGDVDEQGVSYIDPGNLQELYAAARKGEEAHQWLQAEQMRAAIEGAIATGKFPPSRRQYWEAYWASDPEGAKEALSHLVPGLVPVRAAGYAGGAFEDQEQSALYDRMYPDGR